MSASDVGEVVNGRRVAHGPQRASLKRGRPSSAHTYAELLNGPDMLVAIVGSWDGVLSKTTRPCKKSRDEFVASLGGRTPSSYMVGLRPRQHKLVGIARCCSYMVVRGGMPQICSDDDPQLRDHVARVYTQSVAIDLSLRKHVGPDPKIGVVVAALMDTVSLSDPPLLTDDELTQMVNTGAFPDAVLEALRGSWGTGPTTIFEFGGAPPTPNAGVASRAIEEWTNHGLANGGAVHVVDFWFPVAELAARGQWPLYVSIVTKARGCACRASRSTLAPDVLTPAFFGWHLRENGQLASDIAALAPAMRAQVEVQTTKARKGFIHRFSSAHLINAISASKDIVRLEYLERQSEASLRYLCPADAKDILERVREKGFHHVGRHALEHACLKLDAAMTYARRLQNARSR